MAQRGLGRGLSALIPNVNKSSEISDTGENKIIDIDIESIEPNKNQPRRNFYEDSLHELAESFKHFGLLQPIIVRKINEEDRYEIIVGEMSFRAARMAGLNFVPAIVSSYTDDSSSLLMALIENIHREDLNPVEQARTYKQLVEEFNMTHDELSKQVGKSRAFITNILRILSLPVSIQELIEEGKISAGHAKVLVGLKRLKTSCRLPNL